MHISCRIYLLCPNTFVLIVMTFHGHKCIVFCWYTIFVIYQITKILYIVLHCLHAAASTSSRRVAVCVGSA